MGRGDGEFKARASISEAVESVLAVTPVFHSGAAGSVDVSRLLNIGDRLGASTEFSLLGRLTVGRSTTQSVPGFAQRTNWQQKTESR